MLTLMFLMGFKGKKTYQFLGATTFCILYASGDEFHQTFVDGRVGALSDVVLDSIGSIVGCVIAILVIYVVHRKGRNAGR
jgi:VanZ family protein